VTRGTGEEGFAVGVGVNVNASPEGVSRAGALAELVGRELDRTPLLVRLLEALDRWYDVLLRGHLEEVEVHWRARSSILGRQVTLEREGERYRGRVVDLSVTEGIILELAPGLTRLFPTEHVSLVTEPSG
jgi:biotin-(acetyl-CoA carboxylase) ligase